MKKIIISSLFLLSFLFAPLLLIGCDKDEYVIVSNMQRVFDLGENFTLGDDAEVKLISNENEIILTENDYFIKEYISTNEQGIYNVTIGVKSSDTEFSYQILVLDYDSITAYYGQKLGQILLPNDLNVVWKDLNESVGDVGKNFKNAIFYTDDEEIVEIKIPVFVFISQNFWIEELSINDWTYGENANLPSAEAKYEVVNFSYYYNESGKLGEKLEDIPTKAGDYFVEAYVDLYGYEQLSSFKMFSINKAIIDYEIIQQEKIFKEYDSSNYILLNDYNIQDFVAFICDSFEIDETKINFPNLASLVSIDDQTINVSTCGNCYIEISIQLPVDYLNNFIFSNGKTSINLYLNGEILPQTPIIDELPSASEVFYGENLSNSILENGKVVAKILKETGNYEFEVIEGVWSWIDSNEVVLQDGQFEAKFTPYNNNFNQIETFINVNGTLDDGLNVILADEYFDTITELTREEDSFVFEVCEEISYFMLIIEFSQNLSCTYSIFFDDDPPEEIDFECWSGDILTEVDNYDMFFYNTLYIKLTFSDGFNTKVINIELKI